MIELDADRRLPVSAAQESMNGRLLTLYPFCAISVRRTVRADDGVLRDARFRCIFAISYGGAINVVAKRICTRVNVFRGGIRSGPINVVAILHKLRISTIDRRTCYKRGERPHILCTTLLASAWTLLSLDVGEGFNVLLGDEHATRVESDSTFFARRYLQLHGRFSYARVEEGFNVLLGDERDDIVRCL